MTGAAATLIPRFEPAAVGEAVTKAGATLLFGVPTMYHRLAESPRLPDLAGLRLAVSGSAPLPADAARGRAGRQRAGGARAVRDDRDGDAGVQPVRRRAPPGHGRASRCRAWRCGWRRAEGGTAEIEVRGPNVIAGYLDNPAATTRSVHIGRLVPHGRPGSARPGRVPDDQRPGEGAHHHGRLQRLPARGGGGAAVARRCRRRRGRGLGVGRSGARRWWRFVVPGDAVDEATLLSELDEWCAGAPRRVQAAPRMADRRVHPPQRARQDHATRARTVGNLTRKIRYLGISASHCAEQAAAVSAA